MKALKLAGLFVVVLAVFIGVFLLIPNGENSKLPPVSANLYETYRQQITSEWEQAGDWQESLFKQNHDLVQQLSTKYTGEKIDALRQLNSRSAIEVVKKKVFEEWASPTCKKATVDQYVRGVNTIIKTDPAVKSDNDVKQILDVNNTYVAAYNLAHKGVGLKPSFNGDSWQSYDSYAQSLKKQKADIMHRSNYTQYLSNITDIKNGLNAIDSKLKQGRTTYYKSLASAIIDYFRHVERNTENLNKLRSARNRYENEYQANSNLTEFTREFAQNII